MADNEQLKTIQRLANDIIRSSELFKAELNQFEPTETKEISNDLQDVISNTITKLEILRHDIDLSKSGKKHDASGSKSDSDCKLLTHQLKSNLLRHVEIQNLKLERELLLRDKLVDLKALTQQTHHLNEDWTSTQRQSMKLVKLMEQNTSLEYKRVETLKNDLLKSQELVKKYKSMYENNIRAETIANNEHAYVMEMDELRPKTASRAMLTTFRVNDVVRRNECLTEENGDLLKEVQRLKRDNADLLKKAKRSMSDRESILVKLQTSESAKQELYKRLNKEKQKHQSLNKSLTKKASDWIQAKKLIHQLEEDYRWEQIRPLSSQTLEPILTVREDTKLLYTQ